MITPILLCGGSGTRLWPLSRKSYPKQFVPLVGEHSLFQQTAMRLNSDDFSAPHILTGSDFRFIVTEQLMEVGIDPGAILIEPEGRNTAPAILAATYAIAQKDPDALMLVASSDHVVPDAEAFRAAVLAGAEAAQNGQIVTFGIRPTYPETGYGYLELQEDPGDFEPRIIALNRFVEKPDHDKAEQMLASGNFLWNAGIFLFSAKTMMAACKEHAPNLLAPVKASVDQGEPDLGFLRFAPEPWSQAEDISIDYAIMERAPNLSVVPFGGEWSDLGSWEAVRRTGEADDNGVVTNGSATAIDCQNVLLRSEDDSQTIVGIGLENIVAVAMPDAVLVADASRSPDVRKAVSELKAKKLKQATMLPRDHRPWGWFESLAIGQRFQVKRIVVHPGAALSLQSHHHRSEHWIVVEGTAKVTVDDKVQLVSENQSVYIPLGAVHRMENPGKVPMVLIEVQTGTYLGEDDIIRYEDIYARG
ncbi:MAG: mannose-1-phosphate guanylyltransferase/mannose-6-phosphate isomerase [Rhodobacteraceae bacterium]|nr:mannose-1-phosphate guanylyltransferase/mannose-6-phosphate isomerase [Paracoccaceae bacterium]